ncbi:MAG TPA: cysteine desulfurase-like protein [Solirubrobacteraceae bacterium]|nr:cysteine desulfurase-like protein [Solirubrobacteraceae bacterium]
MNRDRFPGAAGDWARLDGPAGTQMVDSAIEAMDGWMRSGRGANHGGAFAAAHATDECVKQARAAVGRLLGAEPAGVAFGPSMTAMTMRLSAAVGRTLVPGDEVVVTRLDHDANVRPWVIAAERAGATVRWAEPDRDTLALPAAAVESVLSDRTRWVAVTAASNASGSVPELDAIIAAVHAAGARISVDAVAAAPHRALDLAALGADTLACSSYKWYGPHIGMLCAAPELLAELVPDKLEPAPDEPPDRFELGTLPFESLAGVTAAAEYMLEVGFDAIRAHEEELLGIAAAELAEIAGVTLYGDPPDRVPTLMFNVAGHTSLEVATALAEREIAVWHGNYYASELERFLGLDPNGAVRAGFVQYNDAEDARRLVEAVREVASGASVTPVASASHEAPA